MISQRAARPSGSVERLQQLSLSNLRGVDETRAPTDRFSVFSATNFVNNLDGSFSLRKPLLIKRDWTRIVKSLSGLSDVDSIVVTRIIPLYTESDFLILFKVEDVNCFTIYNSKTKSFAEKCMLKWHDVSDVEHVKTMFDSRAGVAASQLAVLEGLTDLTAGSVFHANTVTTIGNCNVKLNSDWFEETVDGTSIKYPMCDVSLYDKTTVNGVRTISKPRYIQIYFDLGTWYFSVHNPAVNTFEANPDTGTYEHPLDATLDDMYALRDTYNASVPTVKNIVPYVYTKYERNQIVPTEPLAGTVDVLTPISFSGQISRINGWWRRPYSGGRPIQSGTTQVISTEYYTVTIDLDCDMSLPPFDGVSWYDFHTTFKVQISFKKNIKKFTLQFKAPHIYGYEVSGANFKDGFPVDGEYRHLQFDGQQMLGSISNNVTLYDCIAGTSSEEYVWSTFNQIDKSHSLSYYWTTANLVDVSTSIEVYIPHEAPADVPVKKLTESYSNVRYRGTSLFPQTLPYSFFLKAFCNFPKPREDAKYFATWLYTLDGFSWTDMLHSDSEGDVATYWEGGISLTSASEKPIKDVSKSDADNVNTTHYYVPFSAEEGLSATKRVDMLKISEEFLENYFANASFRFKIVLVKDGKIVATYGQADYVPIRAAEGQYWHSDLGNSVLGEKVYHKGRIFSFGDPSLKNNVFVSYPGEFVTPFKNIIDVNASEDVFVTAVVPWKDYLILTTPQAIYLASQVDTGYLTKTVNTALGISQYDARCITPTLNGLIFKSENKIYMLYPNVYAGDDSVINVTEISKPVENFLFEHEPNPNVKPFAFGTESEYVLVLPEENCSKCLVYNYTTKLWNCLQFPVVFQYHVMYSLTDIVLFGNNSGGGFCEYNFNKSFAEAYGLTDNQIDYGDVLVEPEDGIEEGVADVIAGYASPITVSPIEFELDTGQKTDAILTTKQFVESKMVFATLSPNDSFPMQILIHIDGDPHLVTQDISTDAPFWENSSSGGALNTTFGGVSNESDNFNILRQLVVRYSGKGKSIRHILTGESLYNFKLYETYIRYKLLNVKQ
jgi:hypothetical protein